MDKDNKAEIEAFFRRLNKEFGHKKSVTNESGVIDKSIKDDAKEPSSEIIPQIDAVVIFALKSPERDMFLKACAKNYNDDVRNGVAFRIVEIESTNRSVKLAIATQREMGLVSSAVLSTIALMTYKPQIIIMGGICAGVEGKVSIGDVIVANPTFNHEAGKRTDNGFEANYTHRGLLRSVDDICELISEDKELLRHIRDSWDFKTGKPKTELTVHIVPMGSGSSVITETQTIEKIAVHNRKITGIDMEAFAVAQSAYETLGTETPWLVAKGVQDYANNDKNDESREYAAFVSAKFIIEFIKRFFS